MNTKIISKHLATLGPIGYMKIPGTAATIFTLPLVYALHQTTNLSIIGHVFICVLLTTLAYCIIQHALPLFHGNHDPSEIVLDEVAGCFVTFCGISINAPTLLVGFIFFRFFDITKPFFIKKSERLPGALGIVADDIIAALVAQSIVRIIMLLIS